MWLCLYLIDRMDGGEKILIHQETSWKNKIHRSFSSKRESSPYKDNLSWFLKVTICRCSFGVDFFYRNLIIPWARKKSCATSSEKKYWSQMERQTSQELLKLSYNWKISISQHVSNGGQHWCSSGLWKLIEGAHVNHQWKISRSRCSP